MDEMDKIYRMSFKVHTYEVDFRGKAHLHSLLCFLQEAAARQAILLGFGYENLAPQKLTWLLSRYHIKIDRYPLLGETIEISTWPSGEQGIFALRDFLARDESGETILVATTSWVLWNTEKKQPWPFSELRHQDVVLNERALAVDFMPLPLLERVDWEREFSVLMKDLDLNRHVNNTVYAQWAIETVPPEILLSYFPFEVEISYKAEAFFGEKIISSAQQISSSKEIHESPLGFIHQVVREDKKIELARLRTLWRKG